MKIILAIATTAALTLGIGGAEALVVSPRHWNACEYEDSTRCVWDARHMGNGIGRSFIVKKNGDAIFVPHSVAHQLIYGTP